MKKIVLNIISMATAAYISMSVGLWAIEKATAERGYAAVGGEYLLLPLTFFFVWIVGRKVLEIVIRTAEVKLRRRKRHRYLMKKYQVRPHRT